MALTLLLTLLGCAVATAAGVAGAGSLWSGALLAWGLQGASFWKLWPVLRSGRSALRMWVLGMGARVGGLAVVAGLAAASSLSGRIMAIAYAVTILPLLWVEGVWLARGSRTPEWGEGPRPPGSGGLDTGGRPGRTGASGRAGAPDEGTKSATER